MKHAYQTALFCWATLICMGAYCGSTHGMGIYGNTCKHLHMKQTTEDKILHKRFEVAWARKIKILSEEKMIEEIVSTIPEYPQVEKWVALKRPIGWFIEAVGLPIPQWL